MYLWRFSIAVTLGLVWYFSDCGLSVTQSFICVVFCVSIPLLFGNNGRESSTQTEETKQPPLQETVEEEFVDSVDGQPLENSIPQNSQCPHVKKSMQQVFECAYGQLVLPWYGVAEPCELQPLHGVLSREFDFVTDRIIEKARDFDVCRAVVGSIRILTQHLHNAKQPDREPFFSSAAMEVAVLRELSEALVRCLFSQSFCGQEINHCVLTEIIALKGLGLLVNWLSDPDNLNQLVVNQLDSVTLKSSAEELLISDPDQVSLASQEGDGDGEGGEARIPGAETLPGSDIGGKRRGNRLREGWSKFMDKVKCKKAKKQKLKNVEQVVVMRMMAIQECQFSEDDASSREGSLLSQDDSEREDSDLEDYLASVQEDLMEFKLSYEMWRVGCWTVSISNANWEDEELSFILHLEEKDSPENLQWDIKKTYNEVVFFRNIWQDSTSLPTILELNKSEVSDEVKEEARASVEHFLQELVSDSVIGHSQMVFQFLCPLDKLLNEEEHHGGVWGLLSGLAYFLTPGHEEEENSNPQTEVPKETTVPSPYPESTALTVENHFNSTERSGDIPGSPLPTIVVSQYNSPPQQPEEAEATSDPQPAVNSSSLQENCSQDKPEDSDNTLTSNIKTMFRGLTRSRSQESLASVKSSGDEEQLDETADSQHEGTEGLSWRSAKLNKKEKTSFRMCSGANKAKGKETPGALPRGDEPTKAIFDLLKEISGNSILINIFDAVLKPFTPILRKKVNNFLNKLNPTEEQVASYIDTMRIKLWPETQQTTPPPPSPPPPHTDEERKETRGRAHDLINARYSNYLVLKKTDVESVFNIFQNSEANKTLVYRLLSFLFSELLPHDRLLSSSAVLQKLTTSWNVPVKP